MKQNDGNIIKPIQRLQSFFILTLKLVEILDSITPSSNNCCIYREYIMLDNESYYLKNNFFFAKQCGQANKNRIY